VREEVEAFFKACDLPYAPDDDGDDDDDDDDGVEDDQFFVFLTDC